MTAAELSPEEIQQLATVHQLRPPVEMSVPVGETMIETIDGCTVDVHRMRVRGAAEIYEGDIPYLRLDQEVMLVMLGRVLPPQYTRLKRSGFIVRTNVVDPSASTVVHSQKMVDDMIRFFGFPSTSGLF